MGEVNLEFPHLEFERPTSHYFEDEEFSIVMLPSSGGEFEVYLAPQANSSDFELQVVGNRIVVKPPPLEGRYFVKARWRDTHQQPWTRWSLPLYFVIHGIGEDISSLRVWEHRISLMLEKGIGGTVTLIDPDAEPPGSIGLSTSRWFATPVYEGATPLVNEEPDYYRDPFSYYFDCIDQLVKKGARFLTWHDVLDDRHKRAPLEILLQFDVDGGPKSMNRVYRELVKRGIRASLMVHRRGHHWYPYQLDSLDFDWISESERKGWAIGYHNNALSQVLDSDQSNNDNTLISRATEVFAEDVQKLRQHFTIRTFTHHGGNVYNLKVVPPEKLGIVGVDRASAPSLWESIDTMFSDGGFVSRPSTLFEKVKSLTAGLHFFRNHPFKYGNYIAPIDVPPRFQADLQKVGLKADEETCEWQSRELRKESRWIEQRQEIRSIIRLSYHRLDKPISSRFTPYCEIEERITVLRERRRESFRKLYPWAEGDPRVFWWRMLDAWAPQSGELLNVGALPPESKDENSYFLSANVTVKDVDIDPGRSPDFQMDICQAPESLNNRFDGVMLFGLPYFESPQEAVDACARLTVNRGIGLFGFVADTHPARGSLFNSQNRHVWRREKEPLTNIGLQGNLWAFDRDGLGHLFHEWAVTRIEFMGHYWFVVAQKL